MPTKITESVKLSAKETSGGRLRIKIIDAGEGSSGQYPSSTIELAAQENVFRKGLHMYADHPTAQEGYDRPERTIKDLAAVLETDAVHVPEESALYADVKVYPGWRETLKEMASDIGVSIRASAEIQEAEDGGKPTITRIVEALSVDFVTKAGRGGRIAEVLESAGAADRAVEKGVAEATANDTRAWLEKAVRAQAGETGYSWVRDFDDTTVWYSTEDDGLYAQAYTTSGAGVQLVGASIPVVVRTTYVPVAEAAAPTDSPSVPAGVTENGKEPTVATTNIEESRLAELQTQASRATALEAENAKLHRQVLAGEASKIVAEAFQGITAPRTVARLSKSFTVKEDGTLDADALRAEAEESAAEWKLAQGEGTVRGLGNTTAPGAVKESAAAVPTNEDIVSALKEA